jgi:hypothetical protein
MWPAGVSIGSINEADGEMSKRFDTPVTDTVARARPIRYGRLRYARASCSRLL